MTKAVTYVRVSSREQQELGKIEVYKIGKEYRITREAFEKFLETYAKATS